jgi:hypothetical protein
MLLRNDDYINRLWGIACAQAWHYYQHFPNDATFLKCYVFIALAFDTVHQALAIRARKHNYLHVLYYGYSPSPRLQYGIMPSLIGPLPSRF